jgi:hypothetical protein
MRNYLQIHEYLTLIPNISNKATDRSPIENEKPTHDIGREWGKSHFHLDF